MLKRKCRNSPEKKSKLVSVDWGLKLRLKFVTGPMNRLISGKLFSEETLSIWPKKLPE